MASLEELKQLRKVIQEPVDTVDTCAQSTLDKRIGVTFTDAMIMLNDSASIIEDFRGTLVSMNDCDALLVEIDKFINTYADLIEED